MSTNKHLMLAFLCLFMGAMNALQTNHSPVAQGMWVFAIFGLMLTSTLANEEAEANIKSRLNDEPSEPPQGKWQGE